MSDIDYDSLPPVEFSLSSPLSSLRSLSKHYISSTKQWANDLLIGEILSLHYLYAETKRNLRSFSIGLFTVFLVVCLITLLQNSVLKSPIIFFKIAENAVGENDLLIYPGAGLMERVTLRMNGGLPIINETVIHSGIFDNLSEDQRENKGQIWGDSGRWLLVCTVQNVKDGMKNGSGILLGINSQKEKDISVGRNWPYGEIQKGNAIVSRSLVRQMGYDVDQVVGKLFTLKISIFDILNSLQISGTAAGGSSGSASASSSSPLKSLLSFIAPQTNTPGFWDQKFNISQLFPQFSSQLPPGLPEDNNGNVNITAIVESTLFTFIFSPLPIGQTFVNTFGAPSPFPPTINSQTAAQLILQYNLLTGQHYTQQTVYSQLVLDWTTAYNNPSYDSSSPPPPSTIIIFFLRSLYGDSTLNDVLTFLTPFIISSADFRTDLAISAVVDQPEGKWPESFGSIVLIESQNFIDMFKGNIINTIEQNYTQFSLGTFNVGGIDVPLFIPISPPISLHSLISTFSPSSSNALSLFESQISLLDATTRSLFSIVQYGNRFSTYLKDLDSMNADLQQFTNYVAMGIGTEYPLSFTIPIAITMKTTIYVRYFLDNVFGSVIALIVLLGILLIYSLLLSDVESKTYEYGMLRALGMRQRTLMQILVTKSFSFSLPGVAIGMFAAFLFNIPISITLASYAHIPPTYSFFTIAIIEGLLLGTIMPFVGNVLPISRALSKTLRDSLDVYHHVVSDVKVKMIKLSDLGIDVWQSAIAVLLVVVGFVTFYIVPYAFTFGKIPLFLGILNGILIGMLMGLCIISNSVQPIMERVVLRIILLFSYRHRHLHSIIQKNLSGHRSRNAKTAQMFTICLAFIIFAGAMFSLQATSIADNLKVFLGADVNIMAGQRDFRNALREPEMTQYLNNQIERRKNGDKNAVVMDFAFLTFPMNNIEAMNIIRYSNLASFPRVKNSLYGVPENLLNVIYDEFIYFTDVNMGNYDGKTRNGVDDAVGAMFVDGGKATLPAERRDGKVIVPMSLSSSPNHTALSNNINYYTQNIANTTQAKLSSSYMNYLDVISGEGMRGTASISIDTPTTLYYEYWDVNGDLQANSYLCKVRGIAAKMPAFLYSSYRQTASLGALLIRDSEYLRLLNDMYPNHHCGPTHPSLNYPFPCDVPPTATPKQRLLIRLHDDASTDQREDVINGLRVFFSSDKIQVADTKRIISSTQIAVDFMNLFFIFVGIIAMILCFFILWISFSQNVSESAWEFGVLRSLGVNNGQMVGIYVYEALSLVISTILLGSGIGIIIAVSLILQFNLFTELPFKFQFPTTLFVTMIVTSLVVSVAGSALPAHNFIKKTISQVIRMA